ncbi:MAG: hypothetical protein A2W99_03410 [Bacteroidetes bacterium GWF2_33_16]|nr:MAG: hypothetical protein A2X00_11660 [Bacteroidetes bacterium GWE2_32_14]OFY08298.1 MAG: hypothetical protein A2W99_03410 [Bacteroidetes bacterium GWF2_33_16]
MDDWYYNEFRQSGIDFENESEVAEYDEKYRNNRNLDNEAKYIIELLELNNNSIVFEIGTGTGELAIRLSKLCKHINACDISKTMVNHAFKKAINEKIINITFSHSGFLNFEIIPNYFDAIITQLALHHLPDFWKSVAINRMVKTLKPGGKLFLLDSLFSFECASYEEVINRNIEQAKNKMGLRIANEIAVNIKDEYPTYNWIIEGLFIKNGLKIIRKTRHTELMSSYLCIKV